MTLFTLAVTFVDTLLLLAALLNNLWPIGLPILGATGPPSSQPKITYTFVDPQVFGTCPTGQQIYGNS